MTEKHSRPEDEYFARMEQQRKAKDEIHRQQEERARERRLHSMKCPKCRADLATELFQEVEIDRCIECGGVWLDDGELEELVGHEHHLLDAFLAFFRGKRE